MLTLSCTWALLPRHRFPVASSLTQPQTAASALKSGLYPGRAYPRENGVHQPQPHSCAADPSPLHSNRSRSPRRNSARTPGVPLLAEPLGLGSATALPVGYSPPPHGAFPVHSSSFVVSPSPHMISASFWRACRLSSGMNKRKLSREPTLAHRRPKMGLDRCLLAPLTGIFRGWPSGRPCGLRAGPPDGPGTKGHRA